MTPLDLFPMAFLTFSRITFPALSAVFEAANDKLDSYGRVLLRRWSQRASISQWFKSRESCVTKAMIDIRCARCLHIMRRLVRHRVKSNQAPHMPHRMTRPAQNLTLSVHHIHEHPILYSTGVHQSPLMQNRNNVDRIGRETILDVLSQIQIAQTAPVRRGL